MSLLPILIYGDPRLRAVAAPIRQVTPDIRALADDMVQTMYDAPGRGLAGPQVGRLVRMFVMDCDWRDGAERAPLVVLNPEIAARSETLKSYDEGCLSIPGVVAPVTRPAEVTLRWKDLDGGVHERSFDGIGAVCVQHELDHLDGVLCIDRMDADSRAAVADDHLAPST